MKIRVLFVALLLGAVSLSGMEDPEAIDVSKHVEESIFLNLPSEVLGNIIIKLLESFVSIDDKLKEIKHLRLINQYFNQLFKDVDTDFIKKILLDEFYFCEKSEPENKNHHLCWAAHTGEAWLVKVLIKKGAELDAQNKDCFTPLYCAVDKKYIEVVKLLLENGADVNAQSKNGLTSLHHAAYKGHIETVKVLLASRADVNAQTENGTTPLHQAADCGNTEVVELLIKKGAKVNAQTEKGFTPLHQAAYKGYVETVKALIENGAKVNAQTKNSLTPLDQAAVENHTNVMEVLIKNNANLSLQNTEHREKVEEILRGFPLRKQIHYWVAERSPVTTAVMALAGVGILQVGFVYHESISFPS